MSAERWGLLIGVVTIVVVRVVDWYLPKGWHSRWAERHGVKDPKSKEDNNVEQ